MNRIRRLERDEMAPEMKIANDEHIQKHARMTHMKKTLAHSPVAFRALMSWYDLRDETKPFLGERGINLFCHAISSETDCLICSTFFRRLLIDAGEDPSDLKLSPKEEILVERCETIRRGIDLCSVGHDQT